MCTCFARVDVNVNGTSVCVDVLQQVDVNGTLYKSFARASIHMDVTICKGKYSCE